MGLGASSLTSNVLGNALTSFAIGTGSFLLSFVGITIVLAFAGMVFEEFQKLLGSWTGSADEFAPLHRPGLVIVDEEHDWSYKQDEAPRYHGRDMAIVRARDAGATVLGRGLRYLRPAAALLAINEAKK